VVAKYFEAWTQLVAARPLSEGTAGSPLPRADITARTPAAGDVAGLDIFAVDIRQNLITLRVSPAVKRPMRMPLC